MKKALIILSGGLDSSTLLHYIKKTLKYEEIYALSFNYGQKHSKELEMAKYHCDLLQIKEHKIIDMSFLGAMLKGSSALIDSDIAVPHIKEVLGDPQPLSYVPNRNMVMLSLAVSYAEAKGALDVFYGAQKHDSYSGYWDASPEFLESINKVLMLNRRNKIQIVAPFMDLKKTQLIDIGNKLEVPYEKTWTCYCGREKACGTCPTCCDRIKAFKDAGLIDPLEYEVLVRW